MTLSDFLFGEHLQDLFDVIASLQSSDLAKFQFFIHHRAYRKLGWRVQLFSTHWGKSPFDIISDQLPDANLTPESFQLKGEHSSVHDAINRYVKPVSKTELESVYLVNSDNASSWLALFKSAWAILQSHLFAKDSEGKTTGRVRTDSPSTASVQAIVAMMLVLERLMDVFIHLLSAHGVGQALANAGKLESFCTSQRCAHAFPELAQYFMQRSIEPNPAVSENDEDDDNAEFTGCESCHLQRS